MGRYKFLYYKLIKGEKHITVLDFKLPGTITFTLEDLKSDELPEELKAYMRTIWKSHVESGAYEYKG